MMISNGNAENDTEEGKFPNAVCKIGVGSNSILCQFCWCLLWSWFLHWVKGFFVLVVAYLNLLTCMSRQCLIVRLMFLQSRSDLLSQHILCSFLLFCFCFFEYANELVHVQIHLISFIEVTIFLNQTYKQLFWSFYESCWKKIAAKFIFGIVAGLKLETLPKLNCVSVITQQFSLNLW